MKEPGAEISERATRLFESALVWDMTLPYGPGEADTDVTLPRFHRAGIDCVGLTVITIMGWTGLGLTDAVRHIAYLNAHVRERPDRLVHARTADDILRAKREGKLALVYHFQEMEPFEGRIELISLFYELGVRCALLAYNARNRVGDGCTEPSDAGLSRFGRAVVSEMNRVGMLVDGSHSGYRTTMDAMSVSSAPFIFSHANAYAIVPHVRNIKDDQIRACAATGGVIGINGVGEYLGPDGATTEALFAHVDYIANLVGPQHVGIGLDYIKDVGNLVDLMGRFRHLWPVAEGERVPKPSAFAQPEQLLPLTELMLRRGYGEEAVQGVLGENFLRVARQVWK